MELSLTRDKKECDQINGTKKLKYPYNGLYFSYMPTCYYLYTFCSILMEVKQRDLTVTLGSLTNSQRVYEKLRVAVFEELESEMPDVDYAELSTDQKYLHDIGNAVRSG